jgi:DNA-binding XRE family transcriptional regulator
MLKLSFAEMAGGIGLSRESVYQWQNDGSPRCPSVESIIDICNFFEVEIQTLLFDDLSNKEVDSADLDVYKPVNPRFQQMMPSFPLMFSKFLEDFVHELNVQFKLVNGVSISKVTIVNPSYIAVKIDRNDNDLHKPLHFLTISQIPDKQTLRFLFTSTRETISRKRADNTINLSQNSFDLLSPSAQGAVVTLGIRHRYTSEGNGRFIPELYVKEHPSYSLEMNDFVEIALNNLKLVIEKKS